MGPGIFSDIEVHPEPRRSTKRKIINMNDNYKAVKNDPAKNPFGAYSHVQPKWIEQDNGQE